MASAQLHQPSLLTSPCLYASRRRPVLQSSFTNAVSLRAFGKKFQPSFPLTYTAENVGLNHQQLQGKLKATPNDGQSPNDDTKLHQLHDISTWILDFAASNLLPLALITGVVVGLVYPRSGQIAHQWGLSKWSTSGIFLISGLTLKTGDMLKVASAWPAALFGVVSILFITPLAALPILRLQLNPKELATGLAIFCCVPTTLSSGVSLTQVAGANTALALALTITTNLGGILTMPFLLSSLVGQSVGITLPAGPLLKSLVETLLLPLLLGKMIREFSGYANLLDEKKRYMSMISSLLLGLVPWMQTSCSREMLLLVDPIQLLASIFCGIALHAVYVIFNTTVMWFFPAYWGNKGGDQTSAARAVILVASQKTLPVLVAVVAKLNGALGESGLLVLPCIATHLSQILFDSVLVGYWLDSDKSANKKTA